MKFFYLINLFALVLSSTAYSEELGLLTKERQFKGYPKRHRQHLLGSYELTPSQLHEVYGSRMDVSVEGGASNTHIAGRNLTSSQQSVTARGSVGGDILTLALAAQTRSFMISRDKSNDRESIQSFRMSPEIAATFEDQFTAGATIDLDYLQIAEFYGGTSAEARGGYARPTASFSYHTPKLEVGFAVTGMALTQMKRTREIGEEELALAFIGQRSEESIREAYLPAHQTIFARGNLTDNWSVLGSFSHVQLDSTHESVPVVFRKYRPEDRTAANMQVSYWTSDRSRVSANAFYQGATFAPTGTEQSGLNLRLANVIGANIEGNLRLKKQVYVGALVGTSQGQRNQYVYEQSFRAKERHNRFLGSLSIEL
jgi:hypothetical protein